MKKRKIPLIVLTLIMSACFSLTFVGCNRECKHEWKNTSVRTEPTCTASGSQEQKCTKCDDVQTVEIPALGHEFAQTWSFDENGHWHECTRDGCTVKQNEANHVDEQGDHKCDVCENLSDCVDGDNNHNCDICGKKLSDCVDNDNNHNCDICGNKLSDCADNDNDHNCDICGKKLSDCVDTDNDHDCDICGKKISDCADNDNDHDCDTCGKKFSDHIGGKATCQQKATCAICGDEYGDYAAHAYENGFCSECDCYQPAVKNGNIYEISNAGQLFWFAQMVNGVSTDGTEQNLSANAKLTADIDLGGKTWYPIGLYQDPAVEGGKKVTAQYVGSFNGNFHVVSNFVAKGNGSQGLFGYLKEKTSIKNLGVKNAEVQGWNAGAICGYSGCLENCFAINCTITGYSQTNQDYVKVSALGCNGGLLNVTIKNCFAYNCTLTIDASESTYLTHPVGGASLNTPTRTNCYYGEIKTNKTYNYTAGATEMTKDQFASGEVAYRLNGSVSEGTLAWYQTIGTHEYPVFEGKTVYCDARYDSYCNATEHSGGTATCSEQATCTVCGRKYGTTLEHDSNGVIEHKDADCINDGIVGGTYCTRCNEGKSAAEQTISALGHNSDGVIEHKDADCTNAGVVGGTYCTRCNYGKAAAEQTITALGHTFVNDYCSECGAKKPYGTEGLKFSYDSTTQTYSVTGYSGKDAIVEIPATYNDYTNGEKPVTAIGQDAFRGNTTITKVTILDGVTSIAGYVFKDCENLAEVSLPAGLKSIGRMAFYKCTNLTQINLPNGLTEVGKETFAHSGLTSVVIPESLTALSEDMFYNCESLTSVTIPKTVTTIGSSAFFGCDLLWKINYTGKTAEWGAVKTGSNWWYSNEATNRKDWIIACSNGNVKMFT